MVLGHPRTGSGRARHDAEPLSQGRRARHRDDARPCAARFGVFLPRFSRGVVSRGTAVMTAVLATAATSAVAGGDYGPDTCLDGYVWRGAVATDHVCVTPAVRAQTAQDNAQAAARVDPTGGAYGPDTCLDGFVWREAVVGDHVCVAPAARDQAHLDNLNAPLRRDDVRTAIRTWRPNPVRCDGDVCTTNNDDALRYRVVADGAGTAPNAYFRVRDGSSGRWSARQPVTIGCATL